MAILSSKLVTILLIWFRFQSFISIFAQFLAGSIDSMYSRALTVDKIQEGSNQVAIIHVHVYLEPRGMYDRHLLGCQCLYSLQDTLWSIVRLAGGFIPTV